ncbi:sulfite exporter TauE/SafE family protein [Paraburkholderia sp. JHI869]|uniref:sulfite exporter TauE/SafE family protein n=1 Tax=Paraburkholderia sp. JHI869 TaxID=3112959 RepID=UPI0031734778
MLINVDRSMLDTGGFVLFTGCDTVASAFWLTSAMTGTQTLLIYGAFLAVALLYASTGQAGASGYIAIMALLGYEPDSIKPTALVLNILVSLVANWRFIRDRHFNWQLFWPFALPAIPMALLGGYITLQKTWFEYLLGILLLIAGTLSLARKPSNDHAVRPPSWPVALVCGAVIGFASGLTGVGGGVLLTPLLLLCRWSSTRTAASVSALFILCNSLAALAGNWSATDHLPDGTGRLALVVIVGGWFGAHLGSRWLSPRQIHFLLGIVMMAASLKLLLPV